MLIGGLDIETTGLDWEGGHRIIEAAITFFDENGVKKGHYERRINPQRPIDPKAQEVHGISFEDVSGCPTWEEIGPQFGMLIGKCDLIVAHNGAGFDMPFIRHELLRIGAAVATVPVIDTMLDGRWATPFGKLPNLGELCFACGVEYDKAKAHGAGYDIDVMMQSFFYARGKGFFPLPEALKEAA